MWFGFGKFIEIERNLKQTGRVVKNARKWYGIKGFVGLINLLGFYW